MGRKKNRKASGRGRGRGRGGDGRQPLGNIGQGIVRRQDKNKKGGRGQGNRFANSARNARHSGQRVDLQPTTNQVPEDGFLRLQEITKAHTDAIMAIVMAEDAIYTASRDKLLKRWKVQRDAAGRFEMVVDIEVPLGDTCWSLLSAGEWIFCGLGDGSIKGFSKTGAQAQLKGHSKRINCLLVHESVLLTGGSDNSVRCWQAAPPPQHFQCTHSIEQGIAGAVQALAVLAGKLWVGGTSGLSIVELTTLRVEHQLGPRKWVAGLLIFEGHMIVAYADGCALIFDAGGIEKHNQAPLPAGPVLCIAGLESGPRLLCGHAKGQVSSVVLPAFQLRKHWQALERCKIQCISCAGHDGIFVMGTENGSIQLWQRDSSVP